MADAGTPKGFTDGDSFVYDGNLDSLPDWADKGWATYKAGPALAVPKGDTLRGPYSTDVAMIGDTVFVNAQKNRYAVVHAEDIGEQPGDPDNKPTSEKPLPAKPVGTEHASLEDLDRGGVLPYAEMNPEQQGQMIARGTAPPEATEDENQPSRMAEAPTQRAPRRRKQEEQQAVE